MFFQMWYISIILFEKLMIHIVGNLFGWQLQFDSMDVIFFILMQKICKNHLSVHNGYIYIYNACTRYYLIILRVHSLLFLHSLIFFSF